MRREAANIYKSLTSFMRANFVFFLGLESLGICVLYGFESRTSEHIVFFFVNIDSIHFREVSLNTQFNIILNIFFFFLIVVII